jgi:hypothetical protein
MKSGPRPNGNMKSGPIPNGIDFFSQNVENAHYETQIFFGCRRQW